MMFLCVCECQGWTYLQESKSCVLQFCTRQASTREPLTAATQAGACKICSHWVSSGLNGKELVCKAGNVTLHHTRADLG